MKEYVNPGLAESSENNVPGLAHPSHRITDFFNGRFKDKKPHFVKTKICEKTPNRHIRKGHILNN